MWSSAGILLVSSVLGVFWIEVEGGGRSSRLVVVLDVWVLLSLLVVSLSIVDLLGYLL